jgi:hypothetical protein
MEGQLSKSAHQRQELIKQKIGEVSPLAPALDGVLVKDAPQDQFKEVLRLIMVKVGLRSQNWPEGEEKALLISHIHTNYGGHTLKELVLAFELGMAGKLENVKGEILDINHYENFTCLYFSTVMNGYRQWAKVQKEIIDKNFTSRLYNEMQIEHKEDTGDEAMRIWLKDTVKGVDEGRFTLEFMPVQLSEWLAKNGQLNDYRQYVKEASIKIGKELAAKATYSREDARDYTEFKAMYNSGVLTGHWIDRAEALAKKLVLWYRIWDFINEKKYAADTPNDQERNNQACHKGAGGQGCQGAASS